MLLSIGLIVFGVAIGVLLTGTAACFLFGILHEEMVKAMESHGAVSLLPKVSSVRCPLPAFQP